MLEGRDAGRRDGAEPELERSQQAGLCSELAPLSGAVGSIAAGAVAAPESTSTARLHEH